MRMLTLLAIVACRAPDPSELFHEVIVTVRDDPAQTEDLFLDAVASATDSLHVALPDGEHAALLEAIGEAWSDGLEVELIVDYDQQDDPAIAALIAADAPVTLADDSLSYFEFTLNTNVQWDSTETVMSHAYVVVDRQRIVAATTAGHHRIGPRITVELIGEEMIEDLLIEHNQIFGGVDATAVTAFDAPAKSIADFRWSYGTQTDVGLEMWFGPQERLTKRVVDAVYSARSAVWVMTDEMANEGLAAALQDKAEWGFDVQVVVGPAFRSSSPQLSSELLNNTPDVAKVQRSGVDLLPTLILIDMLPDAEGFTPQARAMILTHDLVSSARLYRGDTVITDQLIDGAMWVLTDHTKERTELLDLDALFHDQFDQGDPL